MATKIKWQVCRASARTRLDVRQRHEGLHLCTAAPICPIVIQRCFLDVFAHTGENLALWYGACL